MITYIHLTILAHPGIQEIRDADCVDGIRQTCLSKQKHRRVRTRSSLIVHVDLRRGGFVNGNSKKTSVTPLIAVYLKRRT